MELVDRWVTVEARELGAEVEPLGLRAEVESGPRRLEAEVRDTPAPATLEDGRPTGLAPYRSGAEGERGGCQTTAVEEAGASERASGRAGGRAFPRSGHWRAFLRSGHWRALSRSGHWRI